MIDLDPIKSLNLKNQKQVTKDKSSIKDFQEILQAKTSDITQKEQPNLINNLTNITIDPTEQYKQELKKRANLIIKKLDLLKLKILNGASLEQQIIELADCVAELELSDSELFTEIIIRAKVEIVKYSSVKN